MRRAGVAARLSQAAYDRPMDEGAQLPRGQPVINALPAKVSENNRWAFWGCRDAMRLEAHVGTKSSLPVGTLRPRT